MLSKKEGTKAYAQMNYNASNLFRYDNFRIEVPWFKPIRYNCNQNNYICFAYAHSMFYV